MPRDYYEILGVPRDADEATIKKSFRRLARELHPDVNAHDPDAEDKFKEAAEAYEVLSDAQRRQTYDAYGHDGLKSGGFSPNFEGFGSISDLFSAFFGQGGGFDAAFGGTRMRGGAVQGGDVALAVAIELGEAARGTSVEVTYDPTVLCETCHGNGAEPGTPIVTCDKCRGAGQIQAVQRTRFGQMVRTALCDKCGGDGRIAETPCHTCSGRGMVATQRHVKVDVLAGIEDGQRLRGTGRGPAGEGGGPGGGPAAATPVGAAGRRATCTWWCASRRTSASSATARTSSPWSTSPRRWPRWARRSRFRRWTATSRWTCPRAPSRARPSS